ncbi:MAG: DUF885 domain-containing protein [Acidobacteriota bacterium]
MMVLLAGAGGLAACGGDDAPSVRLARLADEYWEGHLASHPVMATAIGEREHDHRLRDITPEGQARERGRLERALERASAIPEQKLSPAERLTRLVLLAQLEGELAMLDCGLSEWTVDPMNGPQVAFMNIESFQPVRTLEEGRAMIQRWQAMGPFLDDHMANLRRSMAADKVAVRAAVLKVIEAVRDLLSQPLERWALLKPLETDHSDWLQNERAEFRDGLAQAVRSSVRPAFERYLRFLEKDLLPASRPEDRPGLAHLPGGAECYRNLILVHTSLALSPEELHRTGLQEVERINREMDALGRRALGAGDRLEVLRRLRTDPDLFFGSGEELADRAGSALERAQAALPAWFGRIPAARCEVIKMEPHEEKHSTIAYYREPAIDGSRPGRFYINTSEPHTRPRYELEALAYHEAVPGHHLQVALTQELTGLPEFRRHLGVTAFVEGWALYAERLADEMGLYSSDLDRLGMVSYDAWRACRLVVDTGLHALGWSRQQAIDFMIENTALAENNIVNEVDRYITWPGQALAYKTGQLEMLRLREEAERALGDRFDIEDYHDAVLVNGAIPLRALRRAVEEYVQRASAGRS